MNPPSPKNRLKMMPAGERAHRRARRVAISPPRIVVPRPRPRTA